MSNIVVNAIKFTEQGQVELAVEFQNSQLTFRVTDTGRGISEEHQERLFQAFSQADASTTRKFGGTGLGLILTKKLSQALGGDFNLISSEIGKGSVFAATIAIDLPEDAKLVPVNNIEQIIPKLKQPTREVPNLMGMRILLVEDSPDNQFLFQQFLRPTGAVITVAHDGQEGVHQALLQDFDAILMDIQMPLMDGHQAVRLLRSKGYRGPIIALTAHAMAEEKDRTIASGFSHFLTKPVDRHGLYEILVKIND